MLTASHPAAAAEGSGPGTGEGPTVVGLLTEHLESPLGVGTETPRLSWRSVSNERDQTQLAYRIQLAETTTDLDAETNLLWDTGRVASDRQILVDYDGDALQSATAYVWRVQVWDQSDRVSAWSAPATFETGLLNPSDWTASWINPAGSVASGGSYLRGVVDLDDEPVSARLYVSSRGMYERGPDGQGFCCGQQFGLARGLYVPFVNGERVGDAEYESQWVDSRERSLYRTWDVTELLSAGENTLGFTIGEDSDVIGQLLVTYADGSSETFGTDATWSSAAGPTTQAHKYHGETFDFRLVRSSWGDPDDGGTGWQPVDVVSGPRGVLDAAPNEPMRVVRVHEAVTVTEPSPGVYLVDFGQNISGRTAITATIASGATVTVKHGEKLTNGRIDNGSIGARQTSTILGNGDEVTFRPEYSYAGFRWVEVTGLSSPPVIVAEEIFNDLRSVGGFASSDSMLNRLHVANVQTQVNGLHGLPEDTPTREKRGWMADAYLSAEAIQGNFDAAAFYTKWMQDIRDAQQADGRIPDFVPAEIGWSENTSDPAWSAAAVLIPYYAWQDYGDVRIVDDNYDMIAAWLEHVQTTTTGFIVTSPASTWGNDWLALEQTDGPLFRTGFYFWAADIMSEFAEQLGRTTEAQQYRELADNIAHAINDTYFNGVNSYGTSQFADAFPIVLGIVPTGYEQRVVNNLVAKIEARGGKFTGGLPGIKFIHLALEQSGRSDVVLANLQDTTYPGWGHMLEVGPGTIWEDWNGNDSRNHPMFTSIDDFLYTAVAGLDQAPDSVAYREIVFAPKLTEHLDSASASRLTAYGHTSIDWGRTAEGVDIEVSVPFGATASVRVPQTSVAALTESGWIASEAIGVHDVRQEGADVIVRVGSGDYAFSSDSRLANLVEARQAARMAHDLLSSFEIADPHEAALASSAEQSLSAIGEALAAYRAEVEVPVGAALLELRAFEHAVREAELPANQNGPLAREVSRAIDALSRYLGDQAGVLFAAELSDAVVQPGGTLEWSATLTATGGTPITAVESSVTVPSGWLTADTQPWTPDTVQPGESGSTTVTLTAPGDALPGMVDVVFSVAFTVGEVRLDRQVEASVRVGSSLVVGDAVVDPRVVDAGGSTALRIPVTNERSSAGAEVHASVTLLPRGWSASDVNVTIPPSGDSHVVVQLVSEPDAVGGVGVVTLTDDGGATTQREFAVYVRNASNCGIDTAGEACLPATTRLITSFENGTEGWLPGVNSREVESVTTFANGPGTPSSGLRVLQVYPQGTPARGDWRGAFVELEEPVATVGAHTVTVDLNSYGGAGSVYRARVVVDGATQQSSVEVAVTPDQWNRIRVPLAELNGEDIVRLTVEFRADGTAEWGGYFQIDTVGLDAAPQAAENLARGGVVTARSTLDGWGWSRSALVDGQRRSGSGSNGYTSDPSHASAENVEWVAVDLGDVQPISRVVLYPRTAQGSESPSYNGRNFPVDFEIQVSDDGVTWQTAASFTGQEAADGQPRNYRIDGDASGRFVRVHVTRLGLGAPDEGGDAGGGHRLQLAELEVYAENTDAAVALQPQSVTVAAGDDASLTVVPSGDPLPKVTWHRWNGSAFEPFAGGVGATLRLPAVTTSLDGARFRAQLDNGQPHEVWSDEVTLTVNYAPISITEHPLGVLREASSEEPVTFGATANGTGLRYQWQRLAEGSGWSAMAGETSATLVAPPSALSFGDRFRVVVSNALGEYIVSDAADYRELIRPGITGLPGSVAVRPATPVELVATVIGSPAPALQWMQLGDDEQWFAVEGEESATLSFVAEWNNDGDTFALRATNEAGEVWSEPVVVMVSEFAGDVTPPLVWVDVSGAGDHGWFRLGAVATLSATDDDSGVDRIEYAMGDSEWFAYNEPIVLAEGTSTLWYRAVDRAGNVSEVMSVTSRVDGTAPTVWGWLTESGNLRAIASDGASGVHVVQYSFDGESWVPALSDVPREPRTTAWVRAVDRAGNVSEPLQLGRSELPVPLEAYPGQDLFVESDGWEPGAEVFIELRSTPTLLGTAIADENGVVTAHVQVPEGVSPGQHSLWLFSVDNTEEIPVQVLPLTGAPDGATVWLMATAATLLLVGSVLAWWWRARGTRREGELTAR